MLLVNQPHGKKNNKTPWFVYLVKPLGEENFVWWHKRTYPVIIQMHKCTNSINIQKSLLLQLLAALMSFRTPQPAHSLFTQRKALSTKDKTELTTNCTKQLSQVVNIPKQIASLQIPHHKRLTIPKQSMSDKVLQDHSKVIPSDTNHISGCSATTAQTSSPKTYTNLTDTSSWT